LKDVAAKGEALRNLVLDGEDLSLVGSKLSAIGFVPLGKTISDIGFLSSYLDEEAESSIRKKISLIMDKCFELDKKKRKKKETFSSFKEAMHRFKDRGKKAPIKEEDPRTRFGKLKEKSSSLQKLEEAFSPKYKFKPTRYPDRIGRSRSDVILLGSVSNIKKALKDAEYTIIQISNNECVVRGAYLISIRSDILYSRSLKKKRSKKRKTPKTHPEFFTSGKKRMLLSRPIDTTTNGIWHNEEWNCKTDDTWYAVSKDPITKNWRFHYTESFLSKQNKPGDIILKKKEIKKTNWKEDLKKKKKTIRVSQVREIVARLYKDLEVVSETIVFYDGYRYFLILPKNLNGPPYTIIRNGKLYSSISNWDILGI